MPEVIFDADKDLYIFDDFLKRRPSYKPAVLKRDIKNYFMPLIKDFAKIKEKSSQQDGLVIGISAIQGAGKTTQGEILEILLRHLGYSSCSLSIDDHYLTHKDLTQLRQEDARYIRRGVTHDISLAIEDLTRLKKMKTGQPIIVAGYDKGVHHGDGDRFRWVNMSRGVTLHAEIIERTLVIDSKLQKAKALHLVSAAYKGKDLFLPEDMGSDIPVKEGFMSEKLRKYLAKQKFVEARSAGDGDVHFEGNGSVTVAMNDVPNSWRLVADKPDFIFYDGWMLGAFPVTDDTVFDAELPGLETAETRQLAKDINLKLALYEPLWDQIDYLCILYVPNYHKLQVMWRDQAEEALRAKGQGMTSDEIRDFVHYFWRSVHPAVHLKNLAHNPDKTHQVVIIDDDRTIKEVLTPALAKVKYP